MRIVLAGLALAACLVAPSTVLAKGGGGSAPRSQPRVSMGGEHGGFSFTPSHSINQGVPATNWVDDPAVDPQRAKRHRRHRTTPAAHD